MNDWTLEVRLDRTPRLASRLASVVGKNPDYASFEDSGWFISHFKDAKMSCDKIKKAFPGLVVTVYSPTGKRPVCDVCGSDATKVYGRISVCSDCFEDLEEKEHAANKKASYLSDRYSFVLDWDEVDNDLQEQKIEDMMAYDLQEGNEEEDEEYDEERHRRDCRRRIEAHFPVYF